MFKLAESFAEESIRSGRFLPRAADYGKWAGDYTGSDWLADVPLTIALARSCAGRLQVHPPNENLLLRAAGGFADHLITAYQDTQKVRF